MTISTAADIVAAFPLPGRPDGDAIASAFRNLAAKLLQNAPNNRMRSSLIGVLTREFRQLPAMLDQESATRDKDLALAKLAEIFPDGRIPGADSDDPVIRMANAILALKAGEK